MLITINWALHTGNGKTLKKRWRLDRKVNIHRSPRPGTIFEIIASFPTHLIFHWSLPLNYFSRIFFHVRSVITIGAGCIGAPLVLADYKEDDCVLCASPIFRLIAYYLGFTNRKRKYFEEKMTATLKIKLASIATVRNYILTVACSPTPFIFHYPLPLKVHKRNNFVDSDL